MWLARGQVAKGKEGKQAVEVGKSALTKKRGARGFFPPARKKFGFSVKMSDTSVFRVGSGWCVPAPSGSGKSFLLW